MDLMLPSRDLSRTWRFEVNLAVQITLDGVEAASVKALHHDMDEMRRRMKRVLGRLNERETQLSREF